MTTKQHWTLDSLPWGTLRREPLAEAGEMFYLVTSASFIESMSDLYAHNLVAYFADNAEVSNWLEHSWEPEEMQHGRALREYVRHAWPDFDWEANHARFFADYSALCKPDMLFPKHSLELVSRCVVEMGTASFYGALHRASTEPVLARLARYIFEDEVRHYKHFYKYFRHYRQIENTSQMQVLGVLWKRLKVIGDEDAYLALKHSHLGRHPDHHYDSSTYRDLSRCIRKRIGKHVPHHLSVGMLLKPLDMAPMVQRMVHPVLEQVARLVAA